MWSHFSDSLSNDTVSMDCTLLTANPITITKPKINPYCWMIRNTGLYFSKNPFGKVDISQENKVFYDNETLSHKNN